MKRASVCYCSIQCKAFNDAAKTIVMTQNKTELTKMKSKKKTASDVNEPQQIK